MVRQVLISDNFMKLAKKSESLCCDIFLKTFSSKKGFLFQSKQVEDLTKAVFRKCEFYTPEEDSKLVCRIQNAFPIKKSFPAYLTSEVMLVGVFGTAVSSPHRDLFGPPNFQNVVRILLDTYISLNMQIVADHLKFLDC